MENVEIRRGLTRHVVTGGWVVNARKERRMRSEAVHHSEEVDTYTPMREDHYETYGDDPSLPDVMRSHETTTRYVGSRHWEERGSETVTRTEWRDVEEDVTLHDVALDDGGTMTRVSGLISGDRVYVVNTRRMGRGMDHEIFGASRRRWAPRMRSQYVRDLMKRSNGTPAMTERQAAAMRKAVHRAIQQDMDALRGRLRDAKPVGMAFDIDGLRYLDGRVETSGDQISYIYDGQRFTGAQTPDCPFEHGDLMMTVVPATEGVGMRMALLHNPRTGATWFNPKGTTAPRGTRRLLDAWAGLAMAAAAVVVPTTLHLMGFDRVAAASAFALIILALMLLNAADARHKARVERAAGVRARVEDALMVIRLQCWRRVRQTPS